MKQLTIALVVLSLLAAGAVLAQPADDYMGYRVHLGVISTSAFADDWLYGLDYIWDSGLATLNLFTLEDDLSLSVEVSYLLPLTDDPSFYAGVGGGWANVQFRDPVTTQVTTDDSIIWHLVVGKEFYPKDWGEAAVFVEARYEFGSQLGNTDIDGLRLVAGYRF